MNIKNNSKNVNKDDIFICLKGNTYDGNNYIEQALNNGASIILSDTLNNNSIHIKDTKEFLNKYLYNSYYEYFKDITFIGITGTNGKTTTAFLTYELLKNFNIKTSYIGTLGFYIDNKISDLDNTTPDIITMYDLIMKSLKEKVSVIVMEVSSHALSQDRLYGINFDCVVFTNLTQDHLDYHKDMDNYLNSKKKLFKKVKDKHIKIVNIDSNYGQEFITNNTITYGFNNSDFKILNYKLYINKTKYKFIYNNKTYNITINIPGKYNIYNSIIPIIILNNMGFNINKIIKKYNKINIPKGRMQIINNNNKYIIIDYAHTPDAVLNVLSSAKEFKKNKIYTIIGCGGNRDKTKRFDMANISTSNSDYVIFTNDNPRGESELDIINDMTNNLKNTNYKIITNRSDAIKYGINLLKKNDILFILGKGHEEYQIIKDNKIYFSDYDETLKYINKLDL